MAASTARPGDVLVVGPAAASSGDPAPRPPFVEVVRRRAPMERGRDAPRIRIDVLQVTAWTSGLLLVVIGLVALARAGFDQISLGSPVVTVAGLPASPLLALAMLTLGVALLAAATGEVHDRTLRMTGVAIGVVGTVWTIEPVAFFPLLGVERANGLVAIALAVALVLTSFVPPLSVRRPGIEPGPFA